MTEPPLNTWSVASLASTCMRYLAWLSCALQAWQLVFLPCCGTVWGFGQAPDYYASLNVSVCVSVKYHLLKGLFLSSLKSRLEKEKWPCVLWPACVKCPLLLMKISYSSVYQSPAYPGQELGAFPGCVQPLALQWCEYEVVFIAGVRHAGCSLRAVCVT